MYAPGGAAPSSGSGSSAAAKCGAVEDVPLGHLDLRESVGRHHLAQDDHSCDDHGGAAGLDSGHSDALLGGHGCEPLELFLHRRERESVAVGASRVVRVVSEVQCRERRDRSGDADRVRGLERRKQRPDVRPRAGELRS